MEHIKMQFSLGEKVYLMSDNRVTRGEIISRTYFEDKEEKENRYEIRVEGSSFSTTHPEEKLFKTKQELLNSL